MRTNLIDHRQIFRSLVAASGWIPDRPDCVNVLFEIVGVKQTTDYTWVGMLEGTSCSENGERNADTGVYVDISRVSGTITELTGYNCFVTSTSSIFIYHYKIYFKSHILINTVFYLPVLSSKTSPFHGQGIYFFNLFILKSSWGASLPMALRLRSGGE